MFFLNFGLLLIRYRLVIVLARKAGVVGAREGLIALAADCIARGEVCGDFEDRLSTPHSTPQDTNTLQRTYTLQHTAVHHNTLQRAVCLKDHSWLNAAEFDCDC